MSDIGVKTSLKGYDVNTCADYELLFSSSWPVLKIEAQGTYTINDASIDQDIYTHNLGYVPMFFGYEVSGNTSYLNIKNTYFSATSTKLRWLGGTEGHPAGSITMCYYIYRYSMSTNFTANSIKTSSTSKNVINDCGVKISKDGKNITSTESRDFVLHSSYRTLQIHKTVAFTESSTGWGRTISHYLGYEPLFLFYFESLPGNMVLIPEAHQEFLTNADATNVEVGGIPTGNGFVCIFKDPWSLEE